MAHFDSAAIHFVGALTEVHGAKVQSLLPESVNLILKHFKAAKETEVCYLFILKNSFLCDPSPCWH